MSEYGVRSNGIVGHIVIQLTPDEAARRITEQEITITRLNKENAELRSKRHITLTQAREQALFVSKRRRLQNENRRLTAENKAQAERIEKLNKTLMRLGEYAAQRLGPDELIRLIQKAIEQALKEQP